MSNLTAEAKPGLVDYYKEYAPSRFRKPNGEPHKKRSLQIFAVKFGLPIIRVGWNALIDPEAADNRLRQFADRTDRTPRSPGRPRNAA